MHRTFPCILLVAVGFFLAPVRGQDKLVESEYYPLKIGSAWHYKSGDKTITVKVVKHEKIGDTLCARLESSVDGKVVASEHIAVSAAGIARHSISDIRPEKPVLFLKLPPKVGESWKIETKFGKETIKGSFTSGTEKIKVPADEFTAITSKGEFDINGNQATFGYWFAPKVGIVKMQFGAGGKVVNLELEKYEPAK